MPSDLKKSLVVSAIGMALAVALAPVLAQDTLPPGPGMEETLKACGGCHGIGQVMSEKRGAEEWANTVTMMITLGAPVGQADFDKVVTYLATYFGLNPPPATAGAESTPTPPALPEAAPAPQQ